MSQDLPLPVLFICGGVILAGVAVMAHDFNSRRSSAPTAPIKNEQVLGGNYPFFINNGNVSGVSVAKTDLAVYFRTLAKENPQQAETQWRQLTSDNIAERRTVFMNIRKRAENPRSFTRAHNINHFNAADSTYPSICRYENEFGFLDAFPQSRKDILDACARHFLKSAVYEKNVHPNWIRDLLLVYPQISEDLFVLREHLHKPEMADKVAKKIIHQALNNQDGLPLLRFMEKIHDASPSDMKLYDKIAEAAENPNPKGRFARIWQVIEREFPQIRKSNDEWAAYFRTGLNQKVTESVPLDKFSEKINVFLRRGLYEHNHESTLSAHHIGKNGFLISGKNDWHFFGISVQNPNLKNRVFRENTHTPYTVNNGAVKVFPTSSFAKTLNTLLPETMKQNLFRIAVREIDKEYGFLGVQPYDEGYRDKRWEEFVLTLLKDLPLHDLFDVMVKSEYLTSPVNIKDTGTIRGNIAAWNNEYRKLQAANPHFDENLKGLLELNQTDN